MGDSALTLKRIPAVLAFLLAAFAGVSAAGAPTDYRPAAGAPIEAPALVPGDQAAADDPAGPGDVDPPDSGDAAVLPAARAFAALSRQVASRDVGGACPSRRCAAYRARAPPSL